MAKEILAIKEQYLEEFIEILRCGIANYEFHGNKISENLKLSLQEWIVNEELYIKRLNGE